MIKVLLDEDGFTTFKMEIYLTCHAKMMISVIQLLF